MNRRLPGSTFLITAVATFSLAAPAMAATACKQAHTGLEAHAKIGCDAARAKALSQFKDATVKSSELEEENGRLVYSFDLARAHRAGIEEVQVDAVSGEIVSVSHEDAAAEAQERQQEAQEQAHPIIRKGGGK